MKEDSIPQENLPDVPWITPEGTIDMAKIPLEGVFTQIAKGTPEAARNGIMFLTSACAAGRKEAVIFLMGFLVSLPPDAYEMRRFTVECLHAAKTPACASLLFSELRRVESNNTTRRYLNAIIDTLLYFPPELVQSEFERLAEDSNFSYRMRVKFREIAFGRNPRWEDE